LAAGVDEVCYASCEGVNEGEDERNDNPCNVIDGRYRPGVSVIDPHNELAPPFVVLRKDDKRRKKPILRLNFER